MNRRRALEKITPLFGTNAGLFVGAGVSIPAGLPSWDGLVEPYASELKVGTGDVPAPRLMQYYCSSDRARLAGVVQDLRTTLGRVRITPAHRLISRLGLPRVWTTNFDTLLERAYEDEGVHPEVITSDVDLAHADYSRPQIVKMHGSIDRPDHGLVLMESDYENYLSRRPRLFSLLEHDLSSRSFIFLGISFEDPNLRKVLSAIWNTTGGRPHFLLTVPRTGAKHPPRARRLYQLWKADLGRYGVQVVELASYAEIEAFLYELVGSVRGKTVVILGKLAEGQHRDFCVELGRQLAARRFIIHTGGGPHVGPVVAEAAYAEHQRRGEDATPYLEFFFREGGGSTNPRRGRVTYVGKTWSEMRRRLLSSEKISVVIGSDDASTGGGIGEEVALSRTKGARVVPVAFTGATAREAWQGERGHYQPGGPFHEMQATFEALAADGATPRKAAAAVVRLCEFLLTRSYER